MPVRSTPEKEKPGRSLNPVYHTSARPCSPPLRFMARLRVESGRAFVWYKQGSGVIITLRETPLQLQGFPLPQMGQRLPETAGHWRRSGRALDDNTNIRIYTIVSSKSRIQNVVVMKTRNTMPDTDRPTDWKPPLPWWVERTLGGAAAWVLFGAGWVVGKVAGWW